MMQLWYRASDPKEVRAIPWLHPDAINHLESLLQPNFKVMEFGCGGSTLWFASRVAYVESYETDADWVNEINKKHFSNVTILTNNNGSLATPEKCDLLMIDGEPVEDRARWIIAAPSIVKSGGYVILDNSNRPEYAGERAGLSKYADLIHTVNGNESNTKYLVTEFWKMKLLQDI